MDACAVHISSRWQHSFTAYIHGVCYVTHPHATSAAVRPSRRWRTRHLPGSLPHTGQRRCVPRILQGTARCSFCCCCRRPCCLAAAAPRAWLSGPCHSSAAAGQCQQRCCGDHQEATRDHLRRLHEPQSQQPRCICRPNRARRHQPHRCTTARSRVLQLQSPCTTWDECAGVKMIR